MKSDIKHSKISFLLALSFVGCGQKLGQSHLKDGERTEISYQKTDWYLVQLQDWEERVAEDKKRAYALESQIKNGTHTDVPYDIFESRFFDPIAWGKDENGNVTERPKTAAEKQKEFEVFKAELEADGYKATVDASTREEVRELKQQISDFSKDIDKMKKFIRSKSKATPFGSPRYAHALEAKLTAEDSKALINIFTASSTGNHSVFNYKDDKFYLRCKSDTSCVLGVMTETQLSVVEPTSYEYTYEAKDQYKWLQKVSLMENAIRKDLNTEGDHRIARDYVNLFSWSTSDKKAGWYSMEKDGVYRFGFWINSVPGHIQQHAETVLMPAKKGTMTPFDGHELEPRPSEKTLVKVNQGKSILAASIQMRGSDAFYFSQHFTLPTQKKNPDGLKLSTGGVSLDIRCFHDPEVKKIDVYSRNPKLQQSCTIAIKGPADVLHPDVGFSADESARFSKLELRNAAGFEFMSQTLYSTSSYPSWRVSTYDGSGVVECRKHEGNNATCNIEINGIPK
jgi:hypothetical protein